MLKQLAKILKIFFTDMHINISSIQLTN